MKKYILLLMLLTASMAWGQSKVIEVGDSYGKWVEKGNSGFLMDSIFVAKVTTLNTSAYDTVAVSYTTHSNTKQGFLVMVLSDTVWAEMRFPGGTATVRADTGTTKYSSVFLAPGSTSFWPFHPTTLHFKGYATTGTIPSRLKSASVPDVIIVTGAVTEKAR
jgi:hypothetical protein